jgi:hypothetical protein
MPVSLQVRCFARIPDIYQDALLRPLNDRFMNHQGNINGEVHVPKCVGNSTSKTNQTILLQCCLRERDHGLVKALFTDRTAVHFAIKKSFFHGKDRG